MYSREQSTQDARILDEVGQDEYGTVRPLRYASYVQQAHTAYDLPVPHRNEKPCIAISPEGILLRMKEIAEEHADARLPGRNRAGQPKGKVNEELTVSTARKRQFAYFAAFRFSTLTRRGRISAGGTTNISHPTGAKK
jgi:hypothetical protein